MTTIVVVASLAFSFLVFTPITLLSMRQEAFSLRDGANIQIDVVASTMRFEPAQLRVPPGANVRIDFANQDPSGTPHDFQTFGQRRDVRIVAWPGERRPIVFKSADTPGRYTFICTVRGHSEAGMVGTIIVE